MRFMRFILLFALAGCLASLGSARQTDPVADFFKAYVEAFNSGNHDKMAAFINTHFAPGQDVEARVARMKNFADQAAPITLKKTRDAGQGFWKALGQDSHGMTLTMQAHVVANNRVDRLLFAPGDSFDDDPPRDYSGWKDLASLTSDVCKDTKCPGMAVAMIYDG